MLDAMRRGATGWVAKAFFVVLIASFAVWGIGDVFRTGGPSATLAEVGGMEIGRDEIRRDLDDGFRRLQQQVGGELERSQAIMEGLLRQALDGAVARRLLDAHAHDLGLSVDDDTLAGMIREQPALQTDGSFDRQRFELLLRNSGLSEAGYLAQLRGDLVRQWLVQAVTGAIEAPAALAERIASYRDERRRGRALIVPAETQAVPAPDDATLQSWLDANQQRFTAPELRSVQLVTLSAEDLESEIEIDEAKLRAEYDAQPQRWRTPEQRSARQLLATDHAVIEQAAAMIRDGASLQDVAQRLQASDVTSDEIGPLTKGLLPPALETALFALQPGQVSQPVESPFGWHLMQLTKVEPEVVIPFAEAKEKLLPELRRREAIDRLGDVANRLDDAIAGDSDLARAAREAGAKHSRIDAVDATGRNADGQRITDPALTPEMLTQVFETPKGRTSLLVHGKDDRYFALHVDEVRPARAKALAEIRPEVEAAWRREKQQEAAKVKVAELLARAKAGSTLESLNGDGAALVTIEPLRRAGDPSPLGEAAVAALFATAPGTLAPEPVLIEQGYAVIATDEVLPAAAGGDTSALQASLRAELIGELLQAYEQALRQRYPVTIDQATFAALVQNASR